MKKIALLIIWVFIATSGYPQNDSQFNKAQFPSHLIDKRIIEKRNLNEKMELLSECDWSKRIGKKIDVFWLRTNQGDFFGHSYEYFMDCDNLRLIYWYPNPSETGRIVDFMIENLEDESIWVISKRKHLKNKKKYKKYLN